MRRLRHFGTLALLGALIAVTAPAPSAAQGSFEGRFVLGFRSVEVNGTADKYREDINLDDGPRLFELDLDFIPESAEVRQMVDRVQLDVGNFGGDPFETLRLSVEKYGRYDFTYERRESDYFYHDTLFPPELVSVRNGRTGDFHTFDFRRVRDTAKVEVDLSPRVSFHLGFERFAKTGESTTTLDISRDEFELDRPIDETLEDYVAGFQYAWDKVTLVVEERYREYDNAYEIFLPGQSAGENPDDSAVLDFFFLDQPYSFESTDTTVRVVARPIARLTLRAAGTVQDLSLDIHAAERSGGTAFTGAPFTTDAVGSGAIDRDSELLDLDVTYQINTRFALVGGAWLRQLDQTGDFTFDDEPSRGVWDIETEGAEAGLQVAVSSALTLTGGVRYESRTVSHLAIEGAEPVHDEEVETTDHEGYFGTLGWRPRRDLALNLSYEDSSYDDPFTLSSPTDRTRLSAKGRWGGAAGWWSSASYLLQEYDNSNSGWSAEVSNANLQLGYRGGRFDASVGYGMIEIDRTIDQTVTTNPGFGGGVMVLFPIAYRAESDFFDGRLTWRPAAAWKTGASLRLYENDGSFALERQDFRVFGEYTLATGYIVQLAFRTVDYDETLFDFDDYDADILEVGFGYRW